MRDRAHTISGPSPRRFTGDRGNASSVSSSGSFSFKSNLASGLPNDQKMDRVTGISPQFVFLTLYHQLGKIFFLIKLILRRD